MEPVLSPKEAFYENEQLQTRGLIVEVPLPNSTQKVKQLGHGVKFSKTPITYRHAGYPIGYHTKEVMEQLGYSEDDIKNLKEKGIFR